MSVPAIREKILIAASRLFAASGYDAVSMRHVATEVGMTQANLYNYFRDKEDLIRSSLASVFAGKTQAFAVTLENISDPEQRLERFVSWFVTLLFEDAIFAKLFFRELLFGDEKRLEFLTKDVFQEPFSLLVGLVADCLETKDAVLSALFLTSVIIGHFQLAHTMRHLRESRPEYADPQAITHHLMEEIRKSTKKKSCKHEN